MIGPTDVEQGGLPKENRYQDSKNTVFENPATTEWGTKQPIKNQGRLLGL